MKKSSRRALSKAPALAVAERSPALNVEGLALARALSASNEPAARWIGTNAVRELTSKAALKRVAAKGKAKKRT